MQQAELVQMYGTSDSAGADQEIEDWVHCETLNYLEAVKTHERMGVPVMEIFALYSAETRFTRPLPGVEAGTTP